MAWTTPATVVTGSTITAAWGNTYVRDNSRYLKGMDGAIAFESGASFDTNVLVIDAANNRIGINRSSPAQSLHVVGSVLVATDTNADTGGLSIAQAGGEIAIDTDNRGKQINFHSNGLVIGTGTDAKVGIGKSPVSGALDVDGTAYATAFNGDGSALTALSASQLASGTVPDGRFPATLPAVSGANLTNLDASDLASGTVPDARFPTWIRVTTHTLADGATAQLASGIAKPGGFAMVHWSGGSGPALYGLSDGLFPIAALQIAHTEFSHTAGNSGMINVYWSSANSRYEIENRQGVAVTVRVVIVGYAA